MARYTAWLDEEGSDKIRIGGPNMENYIYMTDQEGLELAVSIIRAVEANQVIKQAIPQDTPE